MVMTVDSRPEDPRNPTYDKDGIKYTVLFSWKIINPETKKLSTTKIYPRDEQGNIIWLPGGDRDAWDEEKREWRCSSNCLRLASVCFTKSRGFQELVRKYVEIWARANQLT